MSHKYLLYSEISLFYLLILIYLHVLISTYVDKSGRKARLFQRENDEVHWVREKRSRDEWVRGEKSY